MGNSKDIEDVHDNSQRQNDEGSSYKMNEPSSRRTFLKRLGTVAFAAVIVDATTGNTTSGDCPCGGGVTDSNCDTGVSDLNCGELPNHADTDQSCSSSGGWSDENCYIGGANAHDKDDNCTATNGHVDAACGDCNDNHDSDEHCAVTGTGDSDQMCGHQHFNETPIYAPIDSDQVCEVNYTVPDIGCGVHDNGFEGGGGATDADDNCDRSHLTPDQNCTGDPIDTHCNQQTYSTQPDESCSSTSSDEACMLEFDSDEYCSMSDSDEHCFQYGLGRDIDDHCDGFDDPDESM